MASMVTAVVPEGVAPGGTFQLQMPDGQMMTVTCPPGATPGQQIQIAMSTPPEPDFIPSEQFAGPRAGYAFKSGASGLGYYKTNEVSAPSSQQMTRAAEKLCAPAHRLRAVHRDRQRAGLLIDSRAVQSWTSRTGCWYVEAGLWPMSLERMYSRAIGRLWYRRRFILNAEHGLVCTELYLLSLPGRPREADLHAEAWHQRLRMRRPCCCRQERSSDGNRRRRIQLERLPVGFLLTSVATVPYSVAANPSMTGL